MSNKEHTMNSPEKSLGSKVIETYAMDGMELGPSMPPMSALSSQTVLSLAPTLSADVILNPPEDLSVRIGENNEDK